ncbi:MAG: hypothetical protein MUP49_06265 [Dehalococcoidia bacterium]|nr:hypothetical protein [Dehalococcoidia bacterium]
MFQLHFTKGILGPEASQKLQNHKITQTIRSMNSDTVQAVFDGKLKKGDLMEILLNTSPVGTAKLLGCFEVRRGSLTDEDANKGGFASLLELQYALRRAGFRFKSLDQYTLYRVLFEWVK